MMKTKLKLLDGTTVTIERENNVTYLPMGLIYKKGGYVIDGNTLRMPKLVVNKKHSNPADDAISLDSLQDNLKDSGYDIDWFFADRDEKFNYNHQEDVEIENIEPTPINEKPLVEFNNEIVDGVNARKRNRKKVLYQLLEIDNKDLNRKEFRILSKYEQKCHITNDNELRNYLNDIHSTLILDHDSKKFNKREVIVSYLNDNFIWGVERASHKTARRYLNNDLFNEWNGEAFDLSARNFIYDKDVWKSFKPWCQKNGFKPRQIATITEFNNYLDYHCPIMLTHIAKESLNQDLINDNVPVDNSKKRKVRLFIREK